MTTTNTWKLHGVVSTVMAAAIVAVNALAFDQGHIAAAPRGVVEVGVLMPVTAAPALTTLLPEVTVSAPRLASAREWTRG